MKYKSIEQIFKDEDVAKIYPEITEKIENAIKDFNENQDEKKLVATFVAMAAAIIPIASHLTGNYDSARFAIAKTCDYIHYVVMEGKEV